MADRKTTIREYPDLEAASRALAERLIREGSAALASRGGFNLALAGGSTPGRLYALLAEPCRRHRLSWPLTQVFWSDERMVPHDHPQSNFSLAWRHLFRHLDPPGACLHPVATDYGSAAQAAVAYQRELERVVPASPSGRDAIPCFDCILLGMGEDGHVASLFPGSPLLAERQRLVAAVEEPAGQPPLPRVTFTLRLINQARLVAVLIQGKRKQTVLEEILAEPARAAERYPAARLRPAGELCWYVAGETAESNRFR